MPEKFDDDDGEWTTLGDAVAPVMLRLFEIMADRQLELLDRDQEAA